MKYRISSGKITDRIQLRRIILKWLIYTICLILFYSLMVCGAFGIWQPFLIIPLAVSVALHERELSSCVFALFCGYFIDIACRLLFGFSAIWLMAVCLIASLLSRNLIRTNLVNFLWIDLAVIILEFSMYYLFNIFIWDIPNRDIIFDKSIFPSVISTIIISPVVYLFIKAINSKLGSFNNLNNYTPILNSDEDESNYETKSKR